MDVFSAFPKAIISGVWQLGQLKRSTEVGKRFEALTGPFDVIIDEISQARTNTSPSAEAILEDTLLYARPEQMPTTNTSTLASEYLWFNSETGFYYDITEVGAGKNQDNGVLEHLEFKIRQTGVVPTELGSA